MLSPRQFSQLSGDLRSKGGFSVNIHTGHEPSSGYLVSDLEGEQRMPLHGTAGRHIRGYAQEHETALTGSNRYLGGWADTDVRPHTAYLDRSTHYPGTSLGHAQAYVKMAANFQKSLFNAGTKDIEPNPAMPQDQPRDLRKSMRRIQGLNVA